jgi:hypothetical protein
MKLSEKTHAASASQASQPLEVKIVSPVPVIPAAAYQLDMGGSDGVWATATAENRDSLALPESFGIVKTTNVDLKSQRTHSDGDEIDSQGSRDVGPTDSQTELKGVGKVV